MSRPASSSPRYCFTALLTDALTLSRLIIAVLLLWLGWTWGRQAFSWAILLATLGWMTDGIDGFIARHSHCPTRLGRIDYPIDVALTWSEFAFVTLADFIPLPLFWGYTGLAALTSLILRQKAHLVLFMRGIDLTLLYLALRHQAIYLIPLLIWLLILAWVQRSRLRQGIPQWVHDLLHPHQS